MEPPSLFVVKPSVTAIEPPPLMTMVSLVSSTPELGPDEDDHDCAICRHPVVTLVPASEAVTQVHAELTVLAAPSQAEAGFAPLSLASQLVQSPAGGLLDGTVGMVSSEGAVSPSG